MQEMIWINGEVIPLADARVGVEDRGFQFADGVYETLRLYDGKPFAIDRHLDRLQLSCNGIGLELPIDVDDLKEQMLRLARASEVADGFLYLQLTRGNAARNHLFPHSANPTLLFYVRPIPPVAPIGSGPGHSLLSVPDERWNRCWVKSISLLANVLARNVAAAAGSDEAAFVHEGWLSECSSSNLFAVIDRTVVTAPVGPHVLPGITRAILLESAAALGISVEERPLSYAEAIAADEIFIASTIREVGWVSQWDNRSVAGTQCGPITIQLHKMFREYVVGETGGC
jgi:D-alanine transaminase